MPDTCLVNNVTDCSHFLISLHLHVELKKRMSLLCRKTWKKDLIDLEKCFLTETSLATNRVSAVFPVKMSCILCDRSINFFRNSQSDETLILVKIWFRISDLRLWSDTTNDFHLAKLFCDRRQADWAVHAIEMSMANVTKELASSQGSNGAASLTSQDRFPVCNIACFQWFYFVSRPAIAITPNLSEVKGCPKFVGCGPTEGCFRLCTKIPPYWRRLSKAKRKPCSLILT